MQNLVQASGGTIVTENEASLMIIEPTHKDDKKIIAGAKKRKNPV